MILHEDKDIYVLNKPAGLAVQGGTKTHRHIDGLLIGLGAELGERPRLVHRLDRETSGVLVIAKRRAVAASLGKLFATRTVRKIYWAGVKGVPKPAQGKIDIALIKAAGPDGDRVRVADADEEEARRAVTHYSVIDKAPPVLAWMSLKPSTGRQHQLRAHMAHIGHPLLGDPVYGRKRNTAECDDAFGQRVHQLHLLVVVLIKEEMQLVKGCAADLPVMLFVQVAEHHGICQQWVERIGAGAAHVFAEPDRHGIDRPELLDHFVLPVLTVPALGDSPQSHCMSSWQPIPRLLQCCKNQATRTGLP